MFYQLVNGGANVNDNINSLFTYHPLQISALVEAVWLFRGNASSTSSPFLSWSPQTTFSILSSSFYQGYDWSTGSPVQIASPSIVAPLSQPGITGIWDAAGAITPRPTTWDHLIYAYLIENTGIFEIFSKVLETYIFSEQLETPSPASQLFWRNLEFLIYGDAVPSMVWTTSDRLRHDEEADRLTSYYWMFGLDLSHAPQIAGQHPYMKPVAANRDFIPTFEAFGREVWRGIVNTRNTSGANDTDATVIATLARRLYDMMATRRINGNLSREEFRAVAVMSFVHLAMLYDSPAVVDLKATASSPETRLQKIAERVGMNSHPKAKALFDLAGPFSVLMQQIETGAFNDAGGAGLLYMDPTSSTAQNAETVVDQYTLATGHDLKANAVSVVPRATPAGVPMHSRPARTPQVPVPKINGHPTLRQ